MLDLIDRSQPPPSPVTTPPSTGPEPDATGRSTSTGLPSNVAAAPACISLIGGIIFYILEKQDVCAWVYAMQSIIFGGAWFLVGIVLKIMMSVLLIIPVIGWFFAILLGILLVLGLLC